MRTWFTCMQRVVYEALGSSTVGSMERTFVVSQFSASEVEAALTRKGFRIDRKAPDFIVCYGGDGTILFGERKFPEVPKLLIKKANVCRKCDYTMGQVESVLSKIRSGEFELKKEMKLETRFKRKRLIGLNEIQVHAKLPIHAVRFSLSVDGKEFSDLIGDGVVVATPFGSTGYYKSTGGRRFRRGIGISFNNLHNRRIRSFVVSEGSLAKVRIDRGPALVFGDNSDEFLQLKRNDDLTIQKSESVANFIYVQNVHANATGG